MNTGCEHAHTRAAIGPRLFRPLDLPAPFPLIDVHVHLGPSDTGEIFYPHLSGDEYLKIMGESNIVRAYAFAPQRDDGYARANSDLAQWSSGTDRRVRAFARLGGSDHPVIVPEAWMVKQKVVGYLKRRPPDVDALEQLKLYAGVKMLPQLDGVPGEAVFARIRELELPVLVHGGTHTPPEFIRRRILPKTAGPLIIAHCGCFPCDDRAFYDAIDIARSEPRVYLDTSGVAVSEFLRYAVDRIPQKLVFGSDAPLNHPMIAWHHLASVVHDDAALERIGFHNASELFID